MKEKKQVWTFFCLLLAGVFLVTTQSFADDEKTDSRVFDLGTVLVTAKGGKVDLATTVTKITSEDMDVQGAQHVADAMYFSPGIDIYHNPKGDAKFSLRGFGDDAVKVLIDGVIVHEAYTGSISLDQFPVDAISRIEITKGASSVLYGPNTLGGVINIITKKGGKEPFTQFTASFGENNTQNYILNHCGSVNKFNYWLTYSFRSTDGFELSDDFDPNNPRTGVGSEYNEDGGTRDLSDYTKRTLNAKIGYDVDANSRIYLSFDYHNNEKGCPTSKNRYWAFSEYDQWHLNLVGEHDFSDLLFMKARLFYVDHQDTLEDVGGWDANHVTAKKWFETSAYDNFSTGGELQAYLDFGKYSLIKMGFSYLKNNSKQVEFYDNDTLSVIRGWALPGYQPEQEYETDTYSIAIEDEINATDKLAIVIGVSYDWFDPQKAYDQPPPGTADAFNPQIGLVYDATDSLSLHASVSRKTRFPQLNEMYSEHLGGNPDLDPKKNTLYEVGAKKVFSNIFNGSIAVFYNDIKDDIDQLPDPVTGDDIYVNIGESEIKGLEMTLNADTPCGLYAGINYTYLLAEEKANDNAPTLDVEGIAKHKVNLDLRYALDFGLSAYIQASYINGIVEYDNTGNKVELDDYYLFNAKVVQQIRRFGKLDSRFFAEIKNIFDKDYDRGTGPNPGRSFLAGLTLTY